MSVAVVGGGLSGLSAAYYLLKYTRYKVTIIEATNRLGGWIQSKVFEDSNRKYLFEKGPHTIRITPVGGSFNTVNLIDELGLANEIRPIFAGDPVNKNKYIYANDAMYKLPSGLLGMFITKPPYKRPQISWLLNDIFTKEKAKGDDESIYDFVARRFGSDAAEYMISPLICGICAGDAKKVSVHLLLSKFFEMEQKHGGIVKGYFKVMTPGKFSLRDQGFLVSEAVNKRWACYTLSDGMEMLTKSLADKVVSKGAKILLNSKCDSVDLDAKKLNVNGKSECFDHMICALPAYNAAELLRKDAYLHENLASIPHVDVAVVNFAYDKNVLRKNAFGCLVAPREKIPVLGISFDSCIYNMDDRTILTVMMGGHWFKEHFGDSPSDNTLLETAEKYVRKILDISDKPFLTEVSVLSRCIPQYMVGHKRKIDDISQYVKDNRLPLSLTGSAYHGVGINDVIYDAKNVVNELKDSNANKVEEGASDQSILPEIS